GGRLFGEVPPLIVDTGDAGLGATGHVVDHGFNDVRQNPDLCHAGGGGASQVVECPRLRRRHRFVDQALDLGMAVNGDLAGGGEHEVRPVEAAQSANDVDRLG